MASKSPVSSSTRIEDVSSSSSSPQKLHFQEECIDTTTNAQPLGRAIRANRSIVLWALAALTGILLYGYDFVIVGNVTSLRAFQRDYGRDFEGQLIIPSSWFALWKAASPLGSTIGAVIGGSFSHRWGRRSSIAVGTIICAIGVAGCIGSAYTGSLARRRGVFLAAKLVQGAGIGQTAHAVQTYASEIVTPRLRGPIMSMIPLLTLIGQLIGAAVIAGQSGVSTQSAYVIPLISMLAFIVPPLMAAFTMPESPVWYIEKGKTSSAERSVVRLHGPNVDTDSLLERVKASVAGNAHNDVSYLDCLKAPERQRTLLVLIAYTSPQLWGITLLSNASYFLQVLGMAERPSLVIVVAGICLGIIGNVGSIWTISSIGRRKLVLYGSAAAAVLWLAVGIANCFENTVTLWFTTGACMLLILLCGLSVWPAYYAIGAEISSLHLRAKSQGLGWGFNGATTTVFAIVIPYIYNLDAGDLRGKTAFVYFGLSTLLVAASWFLVKETKDLSQEQIDKLYGDGEDHERSSS